MKCPSLSRVKRVSPILTMLIRASYWLGFREEIREIRLVEYSVRVYYSDEIKVIKNAYQFREKCKWKIIKIFFLFNFFPMVQLYRIGYIYIWHTYDTFNSKKGSLIKELHNLKSIRMAV